MSAPSRWTRGALTAVLLFGASNGVARAQPDAADPVVATVEGVTILASDIQAEASKRYPAGHVPTPEERVELLRQVVDDRVFYLEALRRGLDKDPKVQKVMVNTLLRDQVYSTVRNSDFDDATLRAYFDAHASEFTVPEKVQILDIRVSPGKGRTEAQAKARAEELRAEVLASPDRFKEIAGQHSDSPYSRRGGDVGFVSREGKEGLDPKVVEAAFVLEVGQVSSVVRAGDGFHVLMVANRRAAVERTFEQMKGSVLRKVKGERVQGLADRYAASLRTKLRIVVHDATLEGVRLVGAGKGAGEAGDGAPGPGEGAPGPGEGAD